VVDRVEGTAHHADPPAPVAQRPSP